MDEEITKFKRHLLATQRVGMENLLSWLDTTDFFIAPASSRYHGAAPGMLLKHSLNVYNLFYDKINALVPGKMTTSSIAIVALLHDLCKTGLYQESAGSYIFRKDIANEGHGVRSLILINKFINLSEQEATLIKYHMGFWNSEVGFPQEYTAQKLKDAVTKYQELQLLWHADVESCFVERSY